MIGLLQRVRRAAVEIDGETVAAIAGGLLVLVGIERGDGPAQAARLLERLLNYRVFADGQGRMNHSLRELRRIAGPEHSGLLLVSQFTLAADTDSGNRPSFTTAAPPEAARALFAELVAMAGRAWPGTGSGRFGADMQLSLVNDGPVTFRLRVPPDGAAKA